LVAARSRRHAAVVRRSAHADAILAAVLGGAELAIVARRVVGLVDDDALPHGPRVAAVVADRDLAGRRGDGGAVDGTQPAAASSGTAYTARASRGAAGSRSGGRAARVVGWVVDRLGASERDEGDGESKKSKIAREMH